MAITKLGQNTLLNSAKQHLGKATKFNVGHPLGVGFAAFGVGSGQSLGESLGMGVGGYASYTAGRDFLKPRIKRKLPGRLGSVATFIGSMGTSFGGAEIGKRIGQKVPIYQRKGNVPPQAYYPPKAT